MAHVAEWKKGLVTELVEMMNNNHVIALVNIDGIPGPQMLKMRKSLWGEVQIKVTKNRLIKLALEEAEKDNPGVSKLLERLDGQCGVVATNINPFKLYQMMKKTITPSPAKGGEVAPDDIVIKAGETPFKPGPIVGEFGKAGIPAAIEKGKVVIKKTITVCKEGEVISKNVAPMLTKLEIFPLKVGMNLTSVYEDGNLYKAKDLDIDVDQFRTDLGGAHQAALNLAMFAAITTPMTMKPLLQKAYQQSIALAVNASIPTKATADMLLTKAYLHMLTLASKVSEESLDDDLKGMVGGAAAATEPAEPPPAADDSDGDDGGGDEPEEEEEVTEEEAVAGLGALFG
jgi:large subunit ribosomal protein L10